MTAKWGDLECGFNGGETLVDHLLGAKPKKQGRLHRLAHTSGRGCIFLGIVHNEDEGFKLRPFRLRKETQIRTVPLERCS